MDSALSIAYLYYDTLRSQLYFQAEKLKNDILGVNHLFPRCNSDSAGLIMSTSEEDKTQTAERFGFLSLLIKDFLKLKHRQYNLSNISMLCMSNIASISIPNADSNSEFNLLAFDQKAISRALLGEIVIQPEKSLSNEYLRAYLSIDDANNSNDSSFRSNYVLILSIAISSDISRSLLQILNANVDYQSLLVYYRPFTSGYILILVMFTAAIVFIAILIGFRLAERLTTPIQLLAIGTQEIARGNLSHKIPNIGDDELLILVKSFNSMTCDIQTTREELISRQRYIETILNNIEVGVISVNNLLKVETINQSATHILHLNLTDTHCSLDCVLGDDLLKIFHSSVSQMHERALESHSSNTSLIAHGGEYKHLQITVSRLRRDLLEANSEIIGHIILIDNLTDLVQAQRLAAWRDVAQRMAHEIKNPLTPIQLSAQRIQKKLQQEANSSVSQTTFDKKAIVEGVSLILSQVEVLKRLVNEFSEFARMPEMVLQVENLNTIVVEVVDMYRRVHPELYFLCELGNIPSVNLDSNQIKQMLVNLLDNAVCAINNTTKCGKIAIRTKLNEAKNAINLSIEDNGSGISDTDKRKIFEPYFSTKKEGSGLGLAIVSNIARDHNATIRVLDNRPSGIVFCIDFSIKLSE